MSWKETENRKVFRRWRKVSSDRAEITSSGKLFQLVGPATGNERPPTVDRLTDGTVRWWCMQSRERRPGRSAQHTSWLRYVGADPCKALYTNQSIQQFLKWLKWHSHCKDHWLGDVNIWYQDMIAGINKSSAVAEMGDRGHNRHGPKRWGAVVPSSNTMWPGPRSTSVPCGVFIHPAVWPQ